MRVKEQSILELGGLLAKTGQAAGNGTRCFILVAALGSKHRHTHTHTKCISSYSFNKCVYLSSRQQFKAITIITPYQSSWNSVHNYFVVSLGLLSGYYQNF